MRKSEVKTIFIQILGTQIRLDGALNDSPLIRIQQERRVFTFLFMDTFREMSRKSVIERNPGQKWEGRYNHQTQKQHLESSLFPEIRFFF